jgi:hypothetical protein
MKRSRQANKQIKLGDSLVSCRKCADGSFITVADDIEALVACQPGLTETEIAKTLFASENDWQRVRMMCRRLITEGRVRRERHGHHGRSVHIFAKEHLAPDPLGRSVDLGPSSYIGGVRPSLPYAMRGVYNDP